MIKEFQVPRTKVVFGVITDISEAKILTVKHSQTGSIYMIETTKDTEITKKTDGKNQSLIKFEDIEVGNRIVAIGSSEENEEKIITAKVIYIIPATNKKQSTPTPSLKSETEE